MNRYSHLELNKDVPAPSGYYTPCKEVRLKFNGREVLYTVNQAVIESSCCGDGDFRSAQVPGYIITWHADKNKEGLPISLVEPITDEPTRGAIRKIIKSNENVSQTEFW